MNLNEYFHIGDQDQPMILEAADPDLPDGLGKQHSKRSNPNLGWMGKMYGGEYNPNKLDYKVYDEMMRDPQIRSCIRLIDYARLSKKYVITPASDDPQDIIVADFVRENIDNLRTPFRLVRKNLYTSLRYGYAVSEVNYTTKVIEGQTRVVWDTIQPLHIATIKDCFEYNDDNTVKTVWQRPLGVYSGTPIPIPGWKCIINTFDEIFGNKYGDSSLNSVYDNHFMKKKILRWYANYLYKLEGPAVIAKGKNKKELQETIDDIKEGTLGGVIDPEDDIIILESRHRGEGFITAINHHNHMIAINFMIGSLLLGQAENQGGAYALGQTHMDVAKIFLDGLHEDDAIPIQEHIRLLVDLNFQVDRYPKFSYEKFTEKDLITLLNALLPYAQYFLIDIKNKGWDELLKQIFQQYADIEWETTEETPTTPTEIDTTTPIPGTGQTPDITDQVKQLIP